ncbi:MAG: ABC transporter permease [Flavobacteriales bacterium]
MSDKKGISPGRQALEKLFKNRIAQLSFGVILLFIITAILGPFLRPDHSPDANTQLLSISRMKPGFEADLLMVRKNEAYIKPNFFTCIADGGWENCSDYVPLASWNISQDSVHYTPIGEEESFTMALVEVLFHVNNGNYKKTSSGYSVEHFMDGKLVLEEFTMAELEELSSEAVAQKTYLLGTDKYGRDYLSRLMAGTSISISVGFIAVFISLLIGILLGLLAGYYGGRTDDLIMWFINVIWSIPTLLMVMAITLVFGKGFWKVFLAVGLTMWVEVARIVRGQVMATRELDYVTAAKSLGFSDLRIMLKHILPNIFSPVIVVTAANFAAAILIEAGLSFLGIGAQVPTPSWGNMIKEHYAYITTDYAYLAILPGICIMVLVLAFMLLGNALRDGLDVRN